jgi:hypothetical protein
MKHSPMFKHAIESFEHGLEHFLDGTERSRKFALLHIDHSIELMLKEKCVQLGKSIYKNDGTTLGIHEVFSSLGKSQISIPEQPRLEELHDLRNTVQHKGLIPDALTAQFHVEIAYDFIKRFLETEMSTPLDEVLPKRYRILMEGLEEPATEVPEESLAQRSALPAILADALAEAWKAENPSSKIIAGYSVLQQTVRTLTTSANGDEKVKFRGTIRNAAVSHGTPQKSVDDAFIPIFVLRGQVLKGDYEATEEDALVCLKAVEAILKMVGFTV